MTTETVTKKPNLADDVANLVAAVNELTALVQSQQQEIEKLKTNAPANGGRNREAQREMTDDDARRIMTGDLKDKKHNEAANMLGLSYGQVYSCRLGYTFKHIHKEMKEAGTKSPFLKND